MFGIVSVGALLVAVTTYYVFRSPDPCETYRAFDIYKLKGEFISHVYGQHIASQMVPAQLDRYFGMYYLVYPPLFLAFHGGQGVGKNYMAQMIIDFFPQKTELIFTAERDFPHVDLALKYARELERRIISTVSECHVNIILFDEVHRIPEEVLAGLRSALKQLEGRRHMPVVVLLLTNANMHAINRVVFDSKLQRHRLKRDEFDFVRKANDWYSSKVWTGTDIVLVPFLPLEQRHVIECIRNDLRLKQIIPTETIIQDVIEQLSFYKQNGINYAIFGCKRVSDRVNLITGLY